MMNRPNDKRGGAKKPYEQPRLTVYCDIRAITNAVGMTGKKDGGTKGTRKTAI